MLVIISIQSRLKLYYVRFCPAVSHIHAVSVCSVDIGWADDIDMVVDGPDPCVGAVEPPAGAMEPPVKSSRWNDWYGRDNEIYILPKSIGTSESNIEAWEYQWLTRSLWHANLDRYPASKNTSNWWNGWYSWITKSTYVLHLPSPTRSFYDPCGRIPGTRLLPTRLPQVQLALLRYVRDYFSTIKSFKLYSLRFSPTGSVCSVDVGSADIDMDDDGQGASVGADEPPVSAMAPPAKSSWWNDRYRRDTINILPKSVGTSNIDAREWLAWSLWDLDIYPSAKSNWWNGWYSWITKSTYVLDLPSLSLYDPCRTVFFSSSARLS